MLALDLVVLDANYCRQHKNIKTISQERRLLCFKPKKPCFKVLRSQSFQVFK
eukprot:NODE_4649_length_563_cov_226.128405_g3387_i0.p4 GENE.NODE_4649_length_563_cov_226.128405_g3387_i0~~NODE_4649_length_563_cov_226.128405_g3387_i0.p4  ORF type:complete len:52 (-),score=2.98 NODE_4649_length_563_cov_226.128405_g3387_i0:117-272(-)